MIRGPRGVYDPAPRREQIGVPFGQAVDPISPEDLRVVETVDADDVERDVDPSEIEISDLARSALEMAILDRRT